jgi:hypothetical protein
MKKGDNSKIKKGGNSNIKKGVSFFYIGVISLFFNMIKYQIVNDLRLCLHREYLKILFKKLFKNNYRKLHAVLLFV